MPITAKFSEKFYDALGHEVAGELVDWFNRADEAYRTDLYRINELNYARFEARFEQRLAELDAKWERRISTVENRIEAVRADLMKWMFGFWAANTATTIGVAIAIVRILR